MVERADLSCLSGRRRPVSSVAAVCPMKAAAAGHAAVLPGGGGFAAGSAAAESVRKRCRAMSRHRRGLSGSSSAAPLPPVQTCTADPTYLPASVYKRTAGLGHTTTRSTSDKMKAVRVGQLGVFSGRVRFVKCSLQPCGVGDVEKWRGYRKLYFWCLSRVLILIARL